MCLMSVHLNRELKLCKNSQRHYIKCCQGLNLVPFYRVKGRLFAGHGVYGLVASFFSGLRIVCSVS